jgi:hypothetical protein
MNRIERHTAGNGHPDPVPHPGRDLPPPAIDEPPEGPGSDQPPVRDPPLRPEGDPAKIA